MNQRLKIKEEFSFIEAPITNKTPSKSINIETLNELVVSPEYYQENTLNYRKALWDDTVPPEKKRALKINSFDYVTPSGAFSYVSRDNLISHTGIICIDIDGIITEDRPLLEIKEDLINDPIIDTLFLFISPGGEGIKWFIRIRVLHEEDHGKYFDALNQYIYTQHAIRIDVACRDISRACFLCYDPDAVYNPDAKPLLSNFLDEWLDYEFEQSGSTTKEDKNRISVKTNTPWDQFNEKFDMHSFLLERGYTLVETNHLGEKYLRPGADAKSEYSLIIFADNPEILHVHSDKCPSLSPGTKTKAKAYCEIMYGGHWKTAVKAMREMGFVGDQPENLTSISTRYLPADIQPFWTINDKGVCTISSYLFHEFINKTLRIFPTNINDYGTDSGTKRLLVQSKGGIVAKAEPTSVISETTEYLRNKLQGNNFALFNMVYDTFMAYINNKSLDKLFAGLKSEEIATLEDTPDTCYLLYANGYLKVTANELDFIPYEASSLLVWKNSILDRDYNGINEKDEGDIKTFVSKISMDDPARFKYVRQVLGYLLHGYKSEAKARAIFFTDEAISNNLNDAAGGTGKSTLAKAIKHMKQTLTIDGKDMQSSGQNRFNLSTIEPHHKVVVLDDLHKTFDFSHLYNNITGDLGVEKKYQNKTYIPFSKAPKFLITTNYPPLERVDDSSLRRIHVVEVGNFFNKQVSVRDYFNKTFFASNEGFTAEDWKAMDTFFIKCIQDYLKDMTIEPVNINFARKQLLKAAGPEFVDFAEETLKVGVTYKMETLLDGRKTKDGFDGFRVIYPEYRTSARHFASKLQAFADYCGWEYIKGRTGPVRWHKFELKQQT